MAIDDVEDDPFLIDGVVHDTATLIFGRPKSGKSYVSISMAYALTYGKPWLGRNVPEAKRCALWTLDPGAKRETRKRWAQIGGGCGLFVTDTTPVYRPGRADGWWDAAIEDLVNNGIEVLIIDNLQRMMPPGASVRFDDQVETVLSRLSAIMDEDIAVILVHHKGKFNEEQGSQQSPMGATCIEAWGRQFVDVTNHGRHLTELRTYGNHTGEASTFVAFHPDGDGEDGFFTLLERQERTATAGDATSPVAMASARLEELKTGRKSSRRKKDRSRGNGQVNVADEVLKILDRQPGGVPKSVFQAQIRAHNTRINAVLDDMEKDGQLKSWTQGRSRMYAKA